MRGPQRFSSGQQRFQGYLDICRKHGLKEQWMDCDYDYEDGLRVAEALLEKYPDADGMIACNDMVAIASYKVLQQKGYRVVKATAVDQFAQTVHVETVCLLSRK